MRTSKRNSLLQTPSRPQPRTVAMNPEHGVRGPNQSQEAPVQDGSIDAPWADLCRTLQRPVLLLAFAEDAA